MKKASYFLLFTLILSLLYFWVIRSSEYGFINTGKFENFKTDLSKTSIKLDDLLEAGASKDSIPALTNPKFTDIDHFNMGDDVAGVLVSFYGEERFYPYNILVWHEVINDSIGNIDFAVTFCPLCRSAIVFDRKVHGQTLDFGVSGFLYQSNLLMYDKKTESFWSQAGLESLVGYYVGTKLKVLPMQMMTFGQVKQKHPQAKVLSMDTGYDRQYDFYPYGDYQESDDILFPISVSNKQFKPKEVMFVVPYDGASIALPYMELLDNKKVVLEFNGKKFEAFRDDDKVTVTMDNEEMPFYYELWFSWATQHQDDGIVWPVN